MGREYIEFMELRFQSRIPCAEVERVANVFITNVFITLGFFLPGFLAKLIWDYLRGRSDEKSELRITVLSLAWNIPSIFLGWVGASLWLYHWDRHTLYVDGFIGLSSFMSFVQTLPHLAAYMGCSVIVDIVFGGLSSWLLRSVLTWRSNATRKKHELPAVTEGLAWERFVGSEDNVTLKIYPMGQEDTAIGGLVESIYQPGDIHRGVTLKETESIGQILGRMTEPTRTFVEFDTKLVFELYTQERMAAIAATFAPPPQAVQGQTSKDENDDTQTEP